LFIAFYWIQYVVYNEIAINRPNNWTEMQKSLVAVLVFLIGLSSAVGQTSQTIRIGLQDDINWLDPVRSGNFADRMVLSAMCDSLVGVGPDLKLIPQLATSWNVSADGKTLTFKLRQGVKFQDNEVFDAAAVKANIDRAMTLPDSNRKGELSSVDHVSVVDPQTVVFALKNPDSSLVAALAYQPGMMLAPKSFPEANSHPVCAGPYQFVRRVQNDRLELAKFQGYWDAKDYPIQKVLYLPIPDSTVRLANLRSGSLDILERLSPSDVASVKSDGNLSLQVASGLGFFDIMFNIGSSPRASKALQDKRVRQAIDLSIDRDALNRVIGAGILTPADQAVPPDSPYHDGAIQVTRRDVAKARALLKAAGYPSLNLDFTFGNNTTANQVAQMLQAMLSESGINLKLLPTDYAAALLAARRSDFQMIYTSWSGRSDPDGNLSSFVTCKGALNHGGYCNPQVDKLLQEAREKQAFAERKPLYDAAQAIVADERPFLYIYYPPYPFVISRRVQGFVPYPDGVVRLRNLSVNR
jgi:peptide/nickel transport system substrate-binding protein